MYLVIVCKLKVKQDKIYEMMAFIVNESESWG